MNPPLIFAIESSCDETSAAVLRGTKVLSNVISSSISKHKKTGGVVPEVAAREHAVNLIPVTKKALKEAGVSLDQVDIFACPGGPGLLSCLLTGFLGSALFSIIKKKPLITVNHIEGHIFSVYLDSEEEMNFPFITLTASGGHNDLILTKDFSDHEVIGSTLDDAAGEAFDKVARFLGLNYPGGPEIERVAKNADPFYFNLPYPLDDKSFNFSFSGLKSATKRLIEENLDLDDHRISLIAACFEERVTEILAKKLKRASKLFEVNSIHLSGGVSANSRLRNKTELIAKDLELDFKFPEKKFCTDNAAMIGIAAFFKSRKKSSVFDFENNFLDLDPRLRV